mmetsp:Transcript_13119/g.45889  ORF Transcript_13119/g.45889 Transcript_13119/m.45889 type:complete len:153 (-) Transcript_13119:165-623(-)
MAGVGYAAGVGDEVASAFAFRKPIAVTAAYMLVYYGFIINQVLTSGRLKRAAKKKGERFNRHGNTEPDMIWADRTVLNMLEQMVPFLVSLWAHAAFVSPDTAAMLGAVYVACRACYPVAWMLNKVLFVTVPNYIIITYLLGSTVAAAFSGSA